MKKIMIAFAALCALQAGAQQSARVTVVLPEDAAVALDYNGLLDLVDTDYYTIPAVWEEGAWRIIVPLDRPQYYSVMRNQLWLSPGDDLKIVPDPVPEKSVITGRGAEAANYLRERIYPKGGSYLRTGKNVRPTLEETLPLLDSIAAARRTALAATDAPEEFKRLESARIDADYLNSLLYYPVYYPRMFGPDYATLTREEYDAHMKQYFSDIEPLTAPLLASISGDDTLLDIDVVRLVLQQYATHSASISLRFREVLMVSEKARRINESLASVQLNELTGLGNSIQDPELRKVYLDKLARNTALMSSKPAIDFAVTTPDGRAGRLSDYKGRVIYIDVWATWCGPCKMETPYFEALTAQYPDILFLAVSVDSDKAAWDKSMATKSASKVVQVHAEEGMTQKWDIASIPRFILIDADFNIITPKAPRPSQTEEIKNLLDALI